jgi:hypothetical protein
MASAARRALLLGWVLVSQPACWGWVRPDAGFTSSTTLRRRRQGVMFGEDIAIAPKTGPVALDLGVHAKITPSAGDVAWSIAVLRLTAPRPVAPYVMGGGNLLQLGSADGALSFGMLSPFAEVGLAWAPPRAIEGLFTLGTRIEYDLRFTSQPHEGFWTVNLGWALGDVPH